MKDAEQYILSLCNMPRQEFMKNPRKCGVYLERVKFFLKLIGSPEKKIPHYIHITGTSGKGSTVNFLESILRASGIKTGSLTSPHPSRVTERWKINGKEMPKKKFIDIVKKIKPALDQYIRTSPYDMISFHELTDAIGFYYFAEEKVEWAVLEVGMGGRFCSSNVITRKDAAVITNIGRDHARLIGPSKEKIAAEKAGIIKQKCLVFTGETNKKILNIITRECRKQNASLHIIDYKSLRVSGKAKILDRRPDGIKFNYKKEQYELSCIGEHQVKNAILTINTAESLKIPRMYIKQGLKRTKQPLRMELMSRSSAMVILDSAHNIEKIKSSVNTIQNLKMREHSNIPNAQYRKHKTAEIHLLVGFSGDKNTNKMVEILSILCPKTVSCTRNTINLFRKVADPKIIAEEFKKKLHKTKIEIFLDPKDALMWSKKQIKKNDILLITGSCFLSGELRPVLQRILDKQQKAN